MLDYLFHSIFHKFLIISMQLTLSHHHIPTTFTRDNKNKIKQIYNAAVAFLVHVHTYIHINGVRERERERPEACCGRARTPCTIQGRHCLRAGVTAARRTDGQQERKICGCTGRLVGNRCNGFLCANSVSLMGQQDAGRYHIRGSDLK